jgi:hypothetical protein
VYVRHVSSTLAFSLSSHRLIHKFCIQFSLSRFIINNIFFHLSTLVCFFAVSGVQSAQSNLGASYFHFRRAAFSNQFKSKCGLLLSKTTTLRINLNLDGTSIASNSHTHPSHSQTSRLLTSSLSLGVPTPRPTQNEGLNETTVSELRMTTSTFQEGDVSRDRVVGQGTILLRGKEHKDFDAGVRSDVVPTL